MLNRPRPQVTAADYAAIGVAPLLIFVMLSALVHFLLLMIYHGGYSARVAWITLMVTMGMVAGARLGIEEGRARSMAYLGVLAVAGVFVLTRFIGSMPVAILLIAVIGILADRIVADCTIIDESVDASGRGLIDLEGRRRGGDETKGTRGTSGRRGHQPGRTVLYLAAAALPLFGLGQFGLSESAGVRGRWLLTAYLFASLSLLVVTAFLNLRRYLRQRGTEMSTRTTIAWLAGGIAAIALILAIAWLAPLPGQTIAGFQTPDWLSQLDTFSPSDLGWGNEGAGEQPQPDGTAAAPEGEPAEESSPPSGEESGECNRPPKPTRTRRRAKAVHRNRAAAGHRRINPPKVVRLPQRNRLIRARIPAAGAAKNHQAIRLAKPKVILNRLNRPPNPGGQSPGTSNRMNPRPATQPILTRRHRVNPHRPRLTLVKRSRRILNHPNRQGRKIPATSQIRRPIGPPVTRPRRRIPGRRKLLRTKTSRRRRRIRRTRRTAKPPLHPNRPRRPLPIRCRGCWTRSAGCCVGCFSRRWSRWPHGGFTPTVMPSPIGGDRF